MSLSVLKTSPLFLVQRSLVSSNFYLYMVAQMKMQMMMMMMGSKEEILDILGQTQLTAFNCILRHRLVKNVWGKPKFRGESVAKGDNCMGISQLLGGCTRAAPPKSTPMYI